MRGKAAVQELAAHDCKRNLLIRLSRVQKLSARPLISFPDLFVHKRSGNEITRPQVFNKILSILKWHSLIQKKISFTDGMTGNTGSIFRRACPELRDGRGFPYKKDGGACRKF